jgi:signal transduction histidine kinase
VETTVYRIIQELLINVAKHAQASSVTIQLLVRNGVLALTVADNGKGFNVMQALSSNSDRRPHYGLRNVRERVEFLGGTFRAESSSTHGTDCMIEIPIGLAALHQEKRDQVA